MPVAFGVKKLVLSCVVEDDKVRLFLTGGGRGATGVSFRLVKLCLKREEKYAHFSKHTHEATESGAPP